MVLHFPLPIWQQMREYVNASLPNEVTGIGAIQILNPHEVKVTHIFLPKQSVSAGYSQFAKGELGRIISNFVGNNPACAGKLCFRWHSHAHGGVFWSSIDEQDISSWKGNHVFNLVTNANSDVLIRLDCFKPFRITIHDVKLAIDYPELSKELRQKYADEVLTKVQPIPPKTKKDWRLEPNDIEFLRLLREEGGFLYEDK